MTEAHHHHGHHHEKTQGAADAADPGKGNQDTPGASTTSGTSTNPPADQVGDQGAPSSGEQAAADAGNTSTADSSQEAGSGDTETPVDSQPSADY